VSDAVVLIVAGAFAGGFVSGLTGFGTGITALPIWLYAVPPVLAGPLVVVASIIGQIQTLPAIWHAIEFRRSMPFIVGGLIGVPLGTLVLPHIPLNIFKLAVAILIIVNCGFLLLRRIPFRVTWGGRIADGVAGWLGGILGGIAGISGPPPTIWSGLRGWSKDARRAVLQSYNLTILTFAFFSHAVAGLVTLELGRVVLIALPGTVLGAFIGRRIYNRLDNVRFDKVVLVLLLIAGVALLATTLRAMSR
jgi:uncharacterized membrane protein YfcA